MIELFIGYILFVSFSEPEISALMVPRVSPSASRKSSRQPSGVGDLFKNFPSFGRRTPIRERARLTNANDTEQGLMLSNRGELTTAKTLPTFFNDVDKGAKLVNAL